MARRPRRRRSRTAARRRRFARSGFGIASLVVCGLLAYVAVDSCVTSPATKSRAARSRRAASEHGAPPIALRADNPAIDVLLTALDGATDLSFSAPAGWKIQNDAGATVAETASGAASAIGLSASGQFLVRGGVVEGSRLLVVPHGDGPLKVATNSYRGVLSVARSGRAMRVVNRLSLEDYLCSVVGSEMYASSTALAALEAQAVAARTYARWEIEERQRSPLPDNQEAQAYYGVGRETALTRRAVENTRNRILQYDGEILPAFYHSTCGGSTVDGTALLGSEAPPPLRGGPCGYCEQGKLYRWNTTISSKSLAAVCGALGIPGTCRAIDPAGPANDRWSKLKIRSDGGEIATSARAFRNAIMKSVRSASLPSPMLHEVVATNEGIRITGRGFGHGVGLCQIGAAEMARQGFDRAAILNRYYPGAVERDAEPGALARR
jgi:stage II sporulation protein D